MKKFTIATLIAASVLTAGSPAGHAQGIINTIAGNGISGYSGDGGPALIAQFSNPVAVSVDPTGNVYIADRNNSRVRKIAAGTGVISTYAGTGAFGLSGMGGAAASAQIRYPDGVFSDASGNLLISDWYNDMVFTVDGTTSNIAAKCGCGSQGCGGDGDDARMALMEIPAAACSDATGNVYIADQGNNRVRMVTAGAFAGTAGTFGIVSTIVNGTGAYGYSGDGGPALLAQTSGISGIFSDPAAGPNVYISEAWNNAIRKIDLETGIITTIAGNGIAGYSGDGGVALAASFNNPGHIYIDGAHNMYVCDRGNNAIRKINLVTNIVTTVAGNGVMGFAGDGGFATHAELNDPEGVWVDATGAIYIADAGNSRIRKVVPVPSSATSGLPVTTAGGGGVSVSSLGINAVAAATSSLGVYPNPSAGSITLQISDEQKGGDLGIYNVAGEKVYSAKIADLQTTISLANQPDGIYTLMLKSATGIYTQKVTLVK